MILRPFKVEILSELPEPYIKSDTRVYYKLKEENIY